MLLATSGTAFLKHRSSREQDSKGRQSLLHGLQSNGDLAAIGKEALHIFQHYSLLQAGSGRAMAGNHSQTACEAMATLQQRARRPCERLRSAGVSPLTGTAATANPTSAPHNRCVFKIVLRLRKECPPPATTVTLIYTFLVNLCPILASMCCAERKGCLHLFLRPTRESCLWMGRYSHPFPG